MRHWWIYIILYAAVGVFGLSPFAGTDIAKLSPVEVVWLEQGAGYVRIETDGKDAGVGKSLPEALEHLKQTAMGTVFLDTAEHVIVKRGSESLLTEASDILRTSCSVCVAETMPDLMQAAAFLSVHEPTVKLKDIGDKELPFLAIQKGGLILIEQENTDTPADGMADRSN